MKRPILHQGSYHSDRRVLEYWTQCEHCSERKDHKNCPCALPGWMHFIIDGKGSVGWSGIITLAKIKRTVRDYLEREESELPVDVYVPPRQLTFEEMDL